MQKRLIWTGCTLIVVVVVVALTVSARPKIVKAAVQATAPTSRECPQDLEFASAVVANKYPVTVVYQWERSDGAKSERRTIEVKSPDQRITEHWHVDAPGKKLALWQRLHILEPTTISSEPARLEVACE
jgi:hypothetical protein